MFKNVMKTIFGDPMERALKPYREAAEKINELEPTISALTDEQLAAKTDEFRQRLQDGAVLADILESGLIKQRIIGIEIAPGTSIFYPVLSGSLDREKKVGWICG